jgi:hypothetical protein
MRMDNDTTTDCRWGNGLIGKQRVLFTRDHPRRGLIFQVAANIAAVIRPVIPAATGIDSANAAVAAHPIEEKASAKVASRDEVWRRRN